VLHGRGRLFLAGGPSDGVGFRRRRWSGSLDPGVPRPDLGAARLGAYTLCRVGGGRPTFGVATAVAAAADASDGGCSRRGAAAATTTDAEERQGLRSAPC
jgi:hypothetical protein